jgi:uncharacterized protein YaeQ
VALTATVRQVAVSLSDVDRGVYETLDLRLAQHPSESARYLALRTLAYCLSYEEGIAFSKGGLSQADEPPLSVRDATGVLLAWIDVGVPSAERLHRAAKAARRVAVYTESLAQLRREAGTRAIHRAEEIEVFRVDAALLDAMELGRKTEIELTRNEGRVYLTIGGKVVEGDVERVGLTAPE